MRYESVKTVGKFYPLIFPHFFFSLIYNGFIKIHEYLNRIAFISFHKVRELCLIITLISSLLL